MGNFGSKHIGFRCPRWLYPVRPFDRRIIDASPYRWADAGLPRWIGFDSIPFGYDAFIKLLVEGTDAFVVVFIAFCSAPKVKKRRHFKCRFIWDISSRNLHECARLARLFNKCAHATYLH